METPPASMTLAYGYIGLRYTWDRAGPVEMSEPGPIGRIAYGRLTGPDAVMICWEATGGRVWLHLPPARAPMNVRVK
jgi:hypothetical protein